MELYSESIFYNSKTNQLNIGKGSEKPFFLIDKQMANNYMKRTPLTSKEWKSKP